MSKNRITAYLYLSIAFIVWAFAVPIIKYVLGVIDPLTFLVYRFGIAAVFAIGYFAINKFRFFRNPKNLIPYLIHAVLTSTITLGLLFVAIKNTSVVDYSIINMISPLIISAMGVWFLKEHVTGREKIGMFIALLGAALITFGPLLISGIGVPMLSGNLLLFAYLIANAASLVLTKKLLKDGGKPMEMTNFTFLVGFLTTLPLLFIFGNVKESIHSIVNLSFNFHVAIFYMALLSGVLAYYFNNKGQKSIEAGEASVFNYLYPLIELPVAVLWLGEKITIVFIIGGIITVIGVIFAELKKPRLAKTRH
jgi:drug/metabolite transporter (DMT)-like permease